MLIISVIIQISYLLRFTTFLELKKIYKIINNIIDSIYWKPLNIIYDFLKSIEGSGDLLFYIARKFVHFCIFLGNSAIPFLCYSCFLIPYIVMLVMLTFTLFFYKFDTTFYYIFFIKIHKFIYIYFK